MNFLSLKNFSLCALMTLMVSCGGGSGGDASTPPVSTPPDVTISATAAAKFLQQASFGATTSDIDALSNMGYDAWLDQQFAAPLTSHLAYIEQLPAYTGREHISAWLSRSVNGNDQLRQRVAFALSELWVVSIHGVDFPTPDSAFKGLTNYYDILLAHAFGNYRDLMEAVTLNPVMGEYLSMKGNQKADVVNNIRPDENYAREMMQLFTIGLHELNNDGSQKLDAQNQPIPTYTQDTIEAMARVFTGWHFANVLQVISGVDEYPDFINPMLAIKDLHDRDEKTVLGDAIIPAGQTAEQDMQQILDIVFNHPNVAPFVSKQLIQKLVTSNPSNAYVERVATVFNNNGSGVRGDLQSVIKAILMDDEALTEITSSDKVFGKLKEPLVRMAGLWRTFGASAGNNEYRLTWLNEFLGQAPLEAHHVFNFFSPMYSPQGAFQDNGWVAPEFEIHTEANQTKMTNFFQYLVLGLNNQTNTNVTAEDVLINLDAEVQLAIDLDALLDHYNLLLFAGDMSTELRTVVKNYVDTYPADDYKQRAVEALGLLVVSPEFMIQD